MLVALVRNKNKKFVPIGCDWVKGRHIYLNGQTLYVFDPSYLTFMPEVFTPSETEIQAGWEQFKQ